MSGKRRGDEEGGRRGVCEGLTPRGGPFPFWPVRPARCPRGPARSRFGPCVPVLARASCPLSPRAGLFPFRPVPPEVKARLENEGNVERKRSP